MKLSPKATLWGLVALSGCCALLTAVAGSAMGAGTTTIKFREAYSYKGTHFTNVDVPPKGEKLSPGDEIVLTVPLVAGGKKIGHVSGVCTATRTARKGVEFLCTGTYIFAHKGTLAYSMNFKPIDDPSKKNHGSIVGGTGQYAGARGTLVISEETQKGANTTVTLFE